MSMDIARQNLELLLDSKKGMWQLLVEESIGRSYFEGFPCATLNFHYETKNGRITEFSNSSPKNDSLCWGYFKFVVFPGKDPPMIDVGYICNGVPDFLREQDFKNQRPAREAIMTLNSTLLLYNNNRMKIDPHAFMGYSRYTSRGMQQQQPIVHRRG